MVIWVGGLWGSVVPGPSCRGCCVAVRLSLLGGSWQWAWLSRGGVFGRSGEWSLSAFCAGRSGSSPVCSLDGLEGVSGGGLFCVARGRCCGDHGGGFFISLKSVAMVAVAAPLSGMGWIPAVGFFWFIRWTHWWGVWVASAGVLGFCSFGCPGTPFWDGRACCWLSPGGGGRVAARWPR